MQYSIAYYFILYSTRGIVYHITGKKARGWVTFSLEVQHIRERNKQCFLKKHHNNTIQRSNRGKLLSRGVIITFSLKHRLDGKKCHL